MNDKFEKPSTAKREDKQYAHNDVRSINKASRPENVESDIARWNGGGTVDLMLPGGKWGRILPQEDGTFLVRSPKGQVYCNSVEQAKKTLVEHIGR